MAAIEWVTEGDDYVCPLSEETQKMAKEELREDKNARDQALDQIRNWIKLNPRIENCRLGEKIWPSTRSFMYSWQQIIGLVITVRFPFDRCSILAKIFKM